MAGYDIHNDSMDSVADIISSTISRSNVNIVEMAESYKHRSRIPSGRRFLRAGHTEHQAFRPLLLGT